jgi:hypothetical protein
MSSNPLSQWLALSKSSLAMYKQLAEASAASMQSAGAQLPDGQAQLAQVIKSMLDMGKQWKDLQAEAFTSLLHTQLGAFKSQQQFVSMQNMMELHQALADDLSSQRYTALKEVAERTNTCVDDLRKAQSKDDISLVFACFFEDVSNKLRDNAEQTFTALNSANAATTILTHKALDGMIGAEQPE